MSLVCFSVRSTREHFKVDVFFFKYTFNLVHRYM